MTFLRAMWDRIGAWLLILGGAVALVLGWVGASDTAYPAEQIPFVISGAILGLFLLGLGATLLISADLRDEWRKLDRIEDAILSASQVAGPSARNGETPSQPGADGSRAQEAPLDEPLTETPAAESRRSGSRARR